ncbi:hypothetical protein H3Z85_18720 [Chryseobacterium indologenes]|nr:hypothetical protein H3Z85_18720 [Chryseobacterium indologenes]
MKPVRFYIFLEILVLTLPGLEILARLKLALIAAVPPPLAAGKERREEYERIAGSSSSDKKSLKKLN